MRAGAAALTCGFGGSGGEACPHAFGKFIALNE
jgi:hypothetical protein